MLRGGSAVTGQARGRARANVALAKYWGKIDERLNLPAVPSVSLTIDALVTETEVRLEVGLEVDQVFIDGALCEGGDARKVQDFLSLLRARVGSEVHAEVRSTNRFPTASGLASSASGFAALAAVSARAYGLDLSPEQLSALARRGSVSAARSIFGGFVELPGGTPGNDSLAARMLHPPSYWDLALVIGLATHQRKAMSSRDGMHASSASSPLYAGWLGSAPRYAFEVREALRTRDIERLGRATEASTFAMHACAWASQPPVRYFRPTTVALLDRVEALRQAGIGAWATMDAGPHVKVLCEGNAVERVSAALREVPGVLEVLVGRPGAGVEVE